MAIDKSKIQRSLFGKFPASSFVPPGLIGHSKKIGLPYDPARARAELRASGFDPLQSVSLEMVTSNWDQAVAISKFVQDELRRNLGIELKIRNLENKAYRTQLDLSLSPLFDFSWTADYPDADNFVSMFLSSSGNSHTHWKSPTYDHLVTRARQVFQPQEREKLYIALQKQLLETEAVIVPLYYEPNLALVGRRVKTFELNSLGYHYLRRVNVGS